MKFMPIDNERSNRTRDEIIRSGLAHLERAKALREPTRRALNDARREIERLKQAKAR